MSNYFEGESSGLPMLAKATGMVDDMEESSESDLSESKMEISSAKSPSSGSAKSSKTGKRKRRSYTDNERELIVLADVKGGRPKRLEVARMLGMPSRTADHIITNYRQNRKVALQDPNKKSVETNVLGKKPKHESELIKLILDWLYMDADMNLDSIMGRVNLEIIRKILVEENAPLEAGEEEPNTVIENLENLQNIPRVSEKYEMQRVRDVSTISGWLNSLIVSRKHHAYEFSNSPEDMDSRLRFCRALLVALVDPKSHLIFIDQVPLSLTLEKGGEKVSQEVQLLFACDAVSGIFHTETFVPRRGPGSERHGVVWNDVIFRRFLNSVAQQLLKQDQHYFAGKNIYFVSNFTDSMNKSLASPNGRSMNYLMQLSQILMESGGACNYITIPANSIPLNLGEFYNRKIRDIANVVLHAFMTEKEKREEILSPKTKKASHTLEKVILTCCKEFIDQPAESPLLVKMVGCLKDIIHANGFIDYEDLELLGL